jgi:CheY-like chemotaxis protein
MEALSPNLCLPCWLVPSVLFTDMFENNYVATLTAEMAPADASELNQRPAGLLIPQSTVGPSSYGAFVKRSAAQANSLRPAGRKRQPQSPKMSVLVVDDVHDVTEMIALFLKHAGYEVVTADSATTALQFAESRNFDLVISDIGMPEMNGYELAGALRGLADYQSIPIIAVTGYTEYDDRGRSLQAGFNAHLTKPIDPTDLLNLINQLLG